MSRAIAPVTLDQLVDGIKGTPDPGFWSSRKAYVETTHAELARVEDERDYLAARVEELLADLTEAESIIADGIDQRPDQADRRRARRLSVRNGELLASLWTWRAVALVLALASAIGWAV